MNEAVRRTRLTKTDLSDFFWLEASSSSIWKEVKQRLRKKGHYSMTVDPMQDTGVQALFVEDNGTIVASTDYRKQGGPSSGF